MTGLDPSRHCIVEIATIVTDKQLQVLGEGPELVIHQNEEALSAMDSWVRNLHQKSGLLEKIQASTTTLAEAEQQNLDFLKRFVNPGKSPMCGNTVCQDRRFLFHGMPTLEKYFHYRHLDVSTLKILAQNWAPDLMKNLKKESRHRALDDIRESIEELRFYRENLLRV